MSALAEEQVDAGDLSLSVAYRGFPIYTETKDLCEQTDCPVKKGPVKVDLEQPFPIITPPVWASASIRELCMLVFRQDNLTIERYCLWSPCTFKLLPHFACFGNMLNGHLDS